MRKLAILMVCGALAGCANACLDNNDGGYIEAAGFKIKKGQQMRAFFDDFEEPMHTYVLDKDTIKWTYYVNQDGEIVRYCELENYKRGSLCELNVEFYKTYVEKAYSNC